MFTMEIINYTTDEVYYFERWSEIEGKLEELQATHPTHEIGVSHFTIFGVEIPYTKENVEFINSHDGEEIEAVITYYTNEYGVVPMVELQDVADYMENRACVTYYLGDDEIEAFENYCDELGMFKDVPEHVTRYIDYEKMLRDYKFDGMGVYRLSYDHPTQYRYMFCN